MKNSLISNEILSIVKHHFDSVIAKDIGGILNNYADSRELLVFVEGPRWATLGYDKVERGWRDYVDSAITVEKCEWIEHLHSKIVGEMGFVAGICEIGADINGNKKIIRFRGTFVLEKDEHEVWKIIHEHFSQPAENPYGIGDWLK